MFHGTCKGRRSHGTNIARGTSPLYTTYVYAVLPTCTQCTICNDCLRSKVHLCSHPRPEFSHQSSSKHQKCFLIRHRYLHVPTHVHVQQSSTSECALYRVGTGCLPSMVMHASFHMVCVLSGCRIVINTAAAAAAASVALCVCVCVCSSWWPG